MMRRPSAVKDRPKQDQELIDGIPAKDIVTTPMEVVAKMWEMAMRWDGVITRKRKRILDPCAGDGRIIKYGLDHFSDFDEDEIEIRDVGRRGYTMADFFDCEVPQKKFDIALMNPPFSKVGIFRFLKRLLDSWIEPWGRVISILPHYAFEQNESRKPWWVQHIYRQCWLPKNTFADQGLPVIHCSIVDFRPQGSGYFETFDFKHGQQELG